MTSAVCTLATEGFCTLADGSDMLPFNNEDPTWNILAGSVGF